MPSTHKKVIVRKMGRDSISGYVSPAHFVLEGKLELLNPSGKVVLIDLAEIKSVDFVRDFSDTAAAGRKTFTSRPRTEGLWVRLKFIDNDVLERTRSAAKLAKASRCPPAPDRSPRAVAAGASEP